jgi:hypothetical protein
MTRTLRAGALTAAALSLVLALVGCVGPTPTPTPMPTPDAASPRPTAMETPTAEPVDPLTTVTMLVARPERLELRDASGAVVASLDYTGSAEEAVATLTGVLGGAPAEEPYEGGNHFPPGVRHTWADVVEIDERFYPDERRAELPHQIVWPRFAVAFLASTALGLDLTTATDVHVGDSYAALDGQIDPDLWTCSGWAVEHVELPRDEYGPLKIGVGIADWSYDAATGTSSEQVDEVVTIMAPLTVADGCA